MVSVHIRLRTGSATVEEASDTRWTILGEQLVDENRHIRLSTADIRLPDGVEFTQYVARIPRCAMTLVLNDNREVLLMYPPGGSSTSGYGSCREGTSTTRSNCMP